MITVLVGFEILAFLVIGFYGRKWDIGLAGGVPPPAGKVSVYLRFLRPNAWILLAALLVFLASPDLNPDLVYVLPAVFFQQAFLFAINDYWDREVDSLNAFKRRRNVLSSGELPLSEAKLLLAAVLLLGLLPSLFLGWGATLLAAIYLFLSYAYSSPPLRLKGRPVWDLVSHGFTVFSYPFLFTTLTLGLFTARNLALYAVFAFISLYIQLGQETRDFEDDSQIETNSVISMGYPKAFLFMTGLLVSGFLLSFWLVLSGRVSTLYLLITCHCAFHLLDVWRSWKSGAYSRCFPNAWGGLYRKTLIGSVPVVLWWLLIRG